MHVTFDLIEAKRLRNDFRILSQSLRMLQFFMPESEGKHLQIVFLYFEISQWISLMIPVSLDFDLIN